MKGWCAPVIVCTYSRRHTLCAQRPPVDADGLLPVNMGLGAELR